MTIGNKFKNNKTITFPKATNLETRETIVGTPVTDEVLVNGFSSSFPALEELIRNPQEKRMSAGGYADWSVGLPQVPGTGSFTFNAKSVADAQMNDFNRWNTYVNWNSKLYTEGQHDEWLDIQKEARVIFELPEGEIKEARKALFLESFGLHMQEWTDYFNTDEGNIEYQKLINHGSWFRFLRDDKKVIEWNQKNKRLPWQWHVLAGEPFAQVDAAKMNEFWGTYLNSSDWTEGSKKRMDWSTAFTLQDILEFDTDPSLMYYIDRYKITEADLETSDWSQSKGVALLSTLGGEIGLELPTGTAFVSVAKSFNKVRKGIMTVLKSKNGQNIFRKSKNARNTSRAVGEILTGGAFWKYVGGVGNENYDAVKATKHLGIETLFTSIITPLGGKLVARLEPQKVIKVFDAHMTGKMETITPKELNQFRTYRTILAEAYDNGNVPKNLRARAGAFLDETQALASVIEEANASVTRLSKLLGKNPDAISIKRFVQQEKDLLKFAERRFTKVTKAKSMFDDTSAEGIEKIRLRWNTVVNDLQAGANPNTQQIDEMIEILVGGGARTTLDDITAGASELVEPILVRNSNKVVTSVKIRGLNKYIKMVETGDFARTVGGEKPTKAQLLTAIRTALAHQKKLYADKILAIADKVANGKSLTKAEQALVTGKNNDFKKILDNTIKYLDFQTSVGQETVAFKIKTAKVAPVRGGYGSKIKKKAELTPQKNLDFINDVKLRIINSSDEAGITFDELGNIKGDASLVVKQLKEIGNEVYNIRKKVTGERKPVSKDDYFGIPFIANNIWHFAKDLPWVATRAAILAEEGINRVLEPIYGLSTGATQRAQVFWGNFVTGIIKGDKYRLKAAASEFNSLEFFTSLRSHIRRWRSNIDYNNPNAMIKVANEVTKEAGLLSKWAYMLQKHSVLQTTQKYSQSVRNPLDWETRWTPEFREVLESAIENYGSKKGKDWDGKSFNIVDLTNDVIAEIINKGGLDYSDLVKTANNIGEATQFLERWLPMFNDSWLEGTGLFTQSRRLTERMIIMMNDEGILGTTSQASRLAPLLQTYFQKTYMQDLTVDYSAKFLKDLQDIYPNKKDLSMILDYLEDSIDTGLRNIGDLTVKTPLDVNGRGFIMNLFGKIDNASKTSPTQFAQFGGAFIRSRLNIGAQTAENGGFINIFKLSKALKEGNKYDQSVALGNIAVSSATWYTIDKMFDTGILSFNPKTGKSEIVVDVLNDETGMPERATVDINASYPQFKLLMDMYMGIKYMEHNIGLATDIYSEDPEFAEEYEELVTGYKELQLLGGEVANTWFKTMLMTTASANYKLMDGQALSDTVFLMLAQIAKDPTSLSTMVSFTDDINQAFGNESLLPNNPLYKEYRTKWDRVASSSLFRLLGDKVNMNPQPQQPKFNMDGSLAYGIVNPAVGKIRYETFEPWKVVATKLFMDMRPKMPSKVVDPFTGITLKTFPNNIYQRAAWRVRNNIFHTEGSPYAQNLNTIANEIVENPGFKKMMEVGDLRRAKQELSSVLNNIWSIAFELSTQEYDFEGNKLDLNDKSKVIKNNKYPNGLHKDSIYYYINFKLPKAEAIGTQKLYGVGK